MPDTIRVSILVKALNEEDKIARCLESAVREAAAVGGEVILVDSLSTDRTVEIARNYPVRIVQFENIADCGCGAAVQLGYQFARGKYLYLLDGDMVLQAGFLATALDYLQANPQVAGVGGLLVDTQLRTAADKRRSREYASITQVVAVDYLGGGGLYRTRAIQSVGYLAHRGLKACEEAELGVRLRAAGWHIHRLPTPAVSHTGHDESSIEMLGRLWRNGRMKAYGVFLRSSVGRPWQWKSARIAWFVFAPALIYLLVLLTALYLLSTGASWLGSAAFAMLGVWSAVLVALSAKKRSVYEGGIAIVAWHLYMLAAIASIFNKVPDPTITIPARELPSRSNTAKL